MRITISVDNDLYRIIQKLRGYMLGESIEMSFSETINRLAYIYFLQNGKLNENQGSFFVTCIPYSRRPNEEDIIDKYLSKFIKEELPRIVDDNIKHAMGLE